MDFTTASLAERGLIYHRPIIYHRKRQTSFPPPRQLHVSGKTFGRVVASPVCFSSTEGEGGKGGGDSLDSGTAQGGHVTRNNEANNESGLDNAVLEISPRRLPKSFWPFLRRAPYIRPRNFSPLSLYTVHIRRYIWRRLMHCSRALPHESTVVYGDFSIFCFFSLPLFSPRENNNPFEQPLRLITVHYYNVIPLVRLCRINCSSTVM